MNTRRSSNTNLTHKSSCSITSGGGKVFVVQTLAEAGVIVVVVVQLQQEL